MNYRLLIGLVVGILCFGCAGTLSVAVADTVDLPNFIKHNQGIGSPSPSPSKSTSTSTSLKSGNSDTCPVANITVSLDSAGYISYYITDKWNVQGMPHDKSNVSSENHKSTLFKTVFVSGTLKATTLPDGEVQISGTDSITKGPLTWESFQNTNSDDDVTWNQTN
jgi:hypothetical protein